MHPEFLMSADLQSVPPHPFVIEETKREGNVAFSLLPARVTDLHRAISQVEHLSTHSL